MDAYYKTTMAATLKLRFKGSRLILIRGAVIEEIKRTIPVRELTVM
jgi:hypothetical protein